MASRFKPLRTGARATLWAAGASVAATAIAGVTLDATAVSLALVALGAFVACALYAVLSLSRYAVAVVAAAGSSLAIGSALAFLRLLGLAWDQDPETVTTVSGADADPYFFGAVAATAATLAVLFGSAVWPERRRASRHSPRLGSAGAAARRPQRAPSSAFRTPGPSTPHSTTPVRKAGATNRPRISASSLRGARRT
ncbi:hypothetical protein RBS60_06660 [Sinomonas sp. ASV486]|uniref:hypothetical protein n=1 Tax=Sinomonas sp. ASV486 TaxID=3051170 RepID=UPI0027DBA1F6|nr:hypothetical protein [Sinomonas sp. ASV486]MDQ4489877.1 hypothetical protein [Sinomonas sp. ASV486]